MLWICLLVRNTDVVNPNLRPELDLICAKESLYNFEGPIYFKITYDQECRESHSVNIRRTIDSLQK